MGTGLMSADRTGQAVGRRGSIGRSQIGVSGTVLMGLLLAGCSAGNADGALCREMSDLSKVVDRYYDAGRSDETFAVLLDGFERSAERLAQRAEGWSDDEIRSEALEFTRGTQRFVNSARAGSYWAAVGALYEMDAALSRISERCEVVPNLRDL